MARQWRIEYPGALYHVLSRGNGGQDIFLTNDDRHQFLALLEDLSDRFNIDIFAYVLMGNHYHLLLKTKDANLSKAMQWFGTTYTRKFNLNHHTSGHLFQGRFKSIIVENDLYLLRLSCYIHRNPLKAGIVDRLSDYPWSSYKFYAYKKKTSKWLKTGLILNQLSGEDKHRGYRTKIQQYSDEKAGLWDDVKHGFIYGSDKFVAKIKKRFLRDKQEPELPQHNRLYREIDAEKLLSSAAAFLDFNLKAFGNNRKPRLEDKDKRDMLVYLLKQTGRFSNQEIGDFFGLTYSAISRIANQFKSRMADDKTLANGFARLNSNIKV